MNHTLSSFADYYKGNMSKSPAPLMQYYIYMPTHHKHIKYLDNLCESDQTFNKKYVPYHPYYDTGFPKRQKMFSDYFTRSMFSDSLLYMFLLLISFVMFIQTLTNDELNEPIPVIPSY